MQIDNFGWDLTCENYCNLLLFTLPTKKKFIKARTRHHFTFFNHKCMLNINMLNVVKSRFVLHESSLTDILFFARVQNKTVEMRTQMQMHTSCWVDGWSEHEMTYCFICCNNCSFFLPAYNRKLQNTDKGRTEGLSRDFKGRQTRYLWFCEKNVTMSKFL